MVERGRERVQNGEKGMVDDELGNPEVGAVSKKKR